MQRKILAVFAHPDDEAFGPGGTFAKYASTGTEIHLLCATRGEQGEWQETKTKKSERLADVREKELFSSAEILGIKSVEFLDFLDGHLSNSIYHQLASKIISKIEAFKPQIIITYDRLGISGHIDHIAVSMITTYSFLKSKIPSKLYYLGFPKEWHDASDDDYFVYFPEGHEDREITTKIDYSLFYKVKQRAMMQHRSQINDVSAHLKRLEKWPKVDHYILQFNRLSEHKYPESDLFSGFI